MVQVLPPVPTFGSRLAQVLSEAGSDIAQGFRERGINSLINSIASGGSQGFQAPQQAAGVGAPGMENQPQQGNPAQSAAQPNQPISDINLVKFSGHPDPRVQKAAEAALKIRSDERKIQAKINAEERAEERKQAEKLSAVQKDVIAGYESAQVSKANLDRMEVLEDTDQLISPLGAYLSDKLGVPVSLTGGPETEEFKKLAAQRGLNVASAYGFGRILQTEFNNFLQTIPDLLNSPDGRRRIVRTLRYFDNIADQRYKNYKQLLRDHKGPTRDFELKLSESMEPAYKKFGDVLVYGDELVEMESPEGQKGRVPKNQVDEALKANYKLIGE